MHGVAGGGRRPPWMTCFCTPAVSPRTPSSLAFSRGSSGGGWLILASENRRADPAAPRGASYRIQSSVWCRFARGRAVSPCSAGRAPVPQARHARRECRCTPKAGAPSQSGETPEFRPTQASRRLHVARLLSAQGREGGGTAVRHVVRDKQGGSVLHSVHGRVGPRLSLQVQAGGGGDRRRWSSVNDADDLAAVDALQVDAGDPEVRMPELALHHD